MHRTRDSDFTNTRENIQILNYFVVLLLVFLTSTTLHGFNFLSIFLDTKHDLSNATSYITSTTFNILFRTSTYVRNIQREDVR